MDDLKFSFGHPAEDHVFFLISKAVYTYTVIVVVFSVELLNQMTFSVHQYVAKECI